MAIIGLILLFLVFGYMLFFGRELDGFIWAVFIIVLFVAGIWLLAIIINLLMGR